MLRPSIISYLGPARKLKVDHCMVRTQNFPWRIVLVNNDSHDISSYFIDLRVYGKVLLEVPLTSEY